MTKRKLVVRTSIRFFSTDIAFYRAPMRRPTLSRYSQIVPVAALLVVFGWAAWERFRLPLTPCAGLDLWLYLGPGLDALGGKPFSEWRGQCFLYPGFLYALLRVGHSFRLITLVQGLLGLGTGALLFGCWVQLRKLLPNSRLPGWIFQLAATLLAAVYFFSTATVQFEHNLTPEAIFPFAVVLQIWCNLQFIRARFVNNRSARALVSGGSALFLSVAAALLKPSFMGAIIFANLPLIISLFRGGQAVREKVALIALPAAATAVLLIWPEHKFRERDATGWLYLTESLFAIHADLINNQIADDLMHYVVTPYSPQFLTVTHVALTQALRESREGEGKHWPALGFNGDYVRFGEPGKRPFLRDLAERLGSEEAAGAFCHYYYWRAVRGQPKGMAAKIIRQMAVFYRFGACPAYVTYKFVDVSELYGLTQQCLSTQPKFQGYPPLAAAVASSAELASSPLLIGPYTLTNHINQFLSKTHLGWCLWALALAVAACVSQNVRDRFGMTAAVLLLLYSYNLGTVLTLAIGHSLDVGKYSQYQFAFTLLPDFASMWLASEMLLQVGTRWKRRRGLHSLSSARK